MPLKLLYKPTNSQFSILNSQFIKRLALDVGFHACGIAEATPLSDEELGFRRWLSDGDQADMHYMEEHVDMRHDPSLLVPGARSVVSLLLGYKPSRMMQGNHRIAMYAYGEDYHTRIKQMLFHLIAAIQKEYPDFTAKPCVDTVPIADKHWAVRAGLGWIGHNTLFVSPQLGSLCNIAELVTPSACDCYDHPIENRCGDCRRCIDACLNRALHAEGDGFRLDARRCTAYHTIENRDERLPEDLRRGGYAFGCDRCQLACPYNEQAPVSVEVSDAQLEELHHLADADEATFRRFARSRALSRIRYWQWKRNLS